MSNVELPLELVELVVDAIASCGDDESLRAFCLTSHHFAHICRKTLFSTIRLVQSPFKQTSETTIAFNNPSLAPFGRTIHSNPSLSQYVRRIHIDYPPQHVFDHSPFVLEYLDNVDDITFGFEDHRSNRRHDPVEWESLPADIRESIILFFSRNPVSKVHLFGIGSFPVAIFHSIRRLSELSIGNCTCQVGIEFPPPRSLISLGLLTESSLNFAESMILKTGTFDISNLERLVVLDLTEATILGPNFLHLLATINALQCLELKFRNLDTGSLHNLVVPHLSTGSLKSLRSISLKIYSADPAVFPPFADLDKELQLLSGVNALQELSLDILITFSFRLIRGITKVDFINRLYPRSWNGLGDVLSSGFPKLRKLDIRFQVALCTPNKELALDVGTCVRTYMDLGMQWAKEFPNLVVNAKAFGSWY